MPTNAHAFSCLIVDDEPMARDVIRRYVEKLPLLKLVGECSNAIDAIVFLQNNHVDLIFLDIRMPELLGTDLVKSLQNPPRIIFTSAYPEYALEGYELDVADYLLKPVKFERFIKAVHKAFRITEQEAPPQAAIQKTGSDMIYIRVDRKLVKIVLSELLFIESAKDYVKLFVQDRYYITRQTISSLEAMLNAHEFVRIHRSYIVAIDKVQSFNNESVTIQNKELPIGKFYRNDFQKATANYATGH